MREKVFPIRHKRDFFSQSYLLLYKSIKRMDPAAVLVAILVFLVFGFLFGNIALCVVVFHLPLFCSVCIFSHAHYITHSFVN